MSAWPEATYVIDEVGKKVTSMSMSPKKASSASASYDKETKQITLSIGGSESIYVDTYSSKDATTPDRSELVSTLKYEIWKQLNSEITSYGEGIKIATVNKAAGVTTFIDNVSDITEDTDFYYAVFSISDKGGINKTDFATATVGNYKTVYQVYGFKQDFTVLDPSQSITYPDVISEPSDPIGVEYQFINAEYNKAEVISYNKNYYNSKMNDFLTFVTDILKNKPYMVKANDGKADYEIHSMDYSVKSDGVTRSDYNNSSYNGGPFAWINKIYSREIYDKNNDYRIVMFSNNPNMKKLDFKPTGFINPSNQELEGVWIPMGYTDNDGKLNVGTTGVVSQNTSAQKTTIEKLTSEAKFFGGPILNVLRDIEYMLFKSTDIQATAGYGRCNGYSANSPSDFYNKYAIPNQDMSYRLDTLYKYLNFGTNGSSGESSTMVMDPDEAYGGFMGCTNPNGKAIPGKMFHSQVLGSYNVFIRDPYTLAVNGKIKVSPNYTYDLAGDSYVDTGKVYIENKSGYPVKLFQTEAGSLPDLDDTSGSTTTGATCDCSYVDVSGVRVARRLGYASGDLYGGPSCVNLDYVASSSVANIGVATLLLPPVGYSPEA